MLKFFSCLFLFTAIVAVTVPSKKDGYRGLSSLKARDCHRAIEVVFGDNRSIAHDAIAREQDRFWNKFSSEVHFPNVKKWRKKYLSKAKHKMMRLNRNPKPAFYVEHDDNSYVLIYRYLGNFLKSEQELATETKKAAKFNREAEDMINEWLESYEYYHSELDLLVEEYAVKKYYLEMLKGIDRMSDDVYPIQKEVQFVENGVTITKVLNISNEEKLTEYIVNFKTRLEEIKGSFWKRIKPAKDDPNEGMGELKGRQFKQAILKKRLVYLKTEIDAMDANRRNLPDGFYELQAKVNELLSDQELAPSLNNVVRLEAKEYKAERKYLRNNVSDFRKRFEKEVSEKLDLLSEREKESLGLNKVGRYSTAFKYSPWALFVSSVLGGTYYGVTDLFTHWDDKAFECIQMDDDDDFKECLHQYMIGKYTKDYLQGKISRDFDQFDLSDLDPNSPDYEKKMKIIEEITAIIEANRSYLEDLDSEADIDRVILASIEDLLEEEYSDDDK